MDVPGKPISELNQAAFMAALGLSSDWKSSLVNLLRSEEEIDWVVRDALADAIEGTGWSGVSLQLSKHERSSRWMKSLAERRNWRAQGQRVASFVDERGPALEEQWENAAEALQSTDSYCKKAYYYFKRCENWKDRARSEGGLYSKLPDGHLNFEFDLASIAQNTSNPQPMSSAEYERFYREKVNGADKLAGAIGLAGWQRNALVEILFFMSRMPEQGD